MGGVAQGRSLRTALTLLLLILLTFSATPWPAAAQGDLRYFAETGHYIRGAFRVFWEQNGGLQTFGYPLSEEYFRRSDNRVVQHFQRARFELAQANPPVVELGMIGREVTGNRVFPQVPPFQTNRERRYFPETGYSLKGLFRRTWEARGDQKGIQLYGYPISEEIQENVNGQWLLVQYFERTRFELRLYPSRVEFGLLGEGMVPPQLRDPWPPEIAPPGPLTEEGNPKPPPGVRPGAPRASIRVSPTALRSGGDITIQGAGFQAGERVTFLLTGPEVYGRPLPQQPLADVVGSINYAGVTFSTRGFANGIWYLTAQGLTSGRSGVAGFTIGDAPPSQGQPPAQPGLRVSPGDGPVGQTFTVFGDGFKPGEKVSFWVTAPDQTVRALPERPDADDNGSITPANIRIRTDSSFFPGVWYITGSGRESGLQFVGAFRITGGAPPPGQQPAPPPSSDPGTRLGTILHDQLVPRGNGSIVPLAGPSGTTFVFTAGGFESGERIGAWLNTPDGKVQELRNAQITTDGNGNTRVAFRTGDLGDGVWSVTAQGARTGRNVTAPFKITRDYVAPLGTTRPASRNGSATPPEGGRSTTFRLSASGFRANERLEFWITSPDGLYVLGSPITADARGRIGVSPGLAVQFSAQNPSGIYGYHYRGTASGVRADIYFTFTGAP